MTDTLFEERPDENTAIDKSCNLPLLYPPEWNMEREYTHPVYCIETLDTFPSLFVLEYAFGVGAEAPSEISEAILKGSSYKGYHFAYTGEPMTWADRKAQISTSH